ncbi:MAG: hypothetical protein HUU02_10675 [Bacteroidetes bacterium]|nr:hypothetical protein [Bacteroidota bacterium]
MKKIISIICLSSALLSVQSCTNESEPSAPAADTKQGISVSSSAVAMLQGDDANIVLFGGTEPYSVEQISQPSVITAQVSGRELTVQAQAQGSATVTVKDASTPARTVTVTVSVVAHFMTGTAGTLSFTSNRGTMTVNGIARYGNTLPDSGSGAIALRDFGSILIVAYTVHSSSSIDLVMIGLESNTSDYSGTYQYPASGKRVTVSYYPNNDPADSSYLEKGYFLASSATATVQSVTAASIQGTFAGNGYYAANGIPNTSQTIQLTNGQFTVPVYTIGTIESAPLSEEHRRLLRNHLQYHKK